MVGWSGSYSHSAGDRFIFKGGVTWPNTTLQMSVTAGGGSGHVDYYGVDQTWYAGGSWARPIFNGGGSVTSGNNNFIRLSPGLSYITIDNIEFTGLYWTGAQTYGNAVYIVINTADHVAITNCYFHGWSHGTYANGTRDDGMCVLGSTSAPYNTGSYVESCTFDGSDTDTASMMAVYATPQILYGCTVRNMSNGFVGVFTLVHDNLIEYINDSFDPQQHENALELLGNRTTIYNNIVRHINAGVSVFTCPVNGETDLYYNNVVYDTVPIPWQIDTNCSNSGLSHVKFYNNTFQGTGALIRAVERSVDPGLASMIAQNNHFITDGGSPFCYNNPGSGCANITSVTLDHNLTQSNATATGQGYTASENYKPTSNSGGTVDIGVSQSGTFITDILGLGRPQGSGWDVGAYERPALAPPKNLRVIP